MGRYLTFLCVVFVLLILESCGLHFKVYNPKHPGKPFAYTQEQITHGSLSSFRTCFDVHFYDLDLKILPSTQTLQGAVQVHATATANFDTLQLDLHPNFSIHTLRDLNTGKSLAYKRVGSAILVAYTQTKNTNFILHIQYEGKPISAKKAPWKGGFVWKKDKNKNPWIGVACESEGAHIWWPLKDHTSDEPDSMRMHYTVPKNLTAVGNGQFKGKTEHGDEATYHWFVSYPINTYNVTVYVGDFKKIEDAYIGILKDTLVLNHYVLSHNYEKAIPHFKQIHPILTVFEQKFGPYPWYRDGFKLVESPYAGMEHQSAIAYGNGYKNDYNETDYIILHETAHEWWGNSVTALDLADAWIQEGFATYSEAIYFETLLGIEAYKKHLLLARIYIQNKYPVVSQQNRRQFHYHHNSDVYGKGAWILHSLRHQIGNDSLFFDLIYSFAKQNTYKLVSSLDFMNHVQAKTGQDYRWFFTPYLYQNEVPELHYYLDKNGDLYYKWEKVLEDFNQVTLSIYYNDKIHPIIPTNKIQKIRLDSGVTIKVPSDILYKYQKNKKLKKQFNP